ncbi:hypothetical protein DFQ27_006082 [Actinomortierella ambigua]|uniref:Gamma-soluble NSF attachment protein n=1 Tax=Actinomortierella ambigua TaxID=1343610 RepID=A0A9P6PZ32_9FUNG|nr:hypothetical protein DFQ27_006082 [Actinomortierella ambigua]
MSLEEARLKDAVKWMHEAEKHTEKGWFKKPDWDLAAQYYEKAATSFKAGKSYDQAVQAFVKASDAMAMASSIFMAARAMENAATVALQNLSQPERAADMYKKASEYYTQNMTPDRAAEMLEKSAKAMEPVSVDTAINLYIGALNIYDAEDRARYATDTFKRAISLMVKHRRFDNALETLQRLGMVQEKTSNKTAYYKTLLSIVIIRLAAGDEVDAGKRFQSFCSVDGFVRSEECAIAHAMLDAFEHRDQQYFDQTASRQHIGFLDNEIAKLVRSIKVSTDLIGGGGFEDPNAPRPGSGGPPGNAGYGQPGPYDNKQQQQQGFPPSFQQQPYQQPGFQQGPPPPPLPSSHQQQFQQGPPPPPAPAQQFQQHDYKQPRPTNPSRDQFQQPPQHQQGPPQGGLYQAHPTGGYTEDPAPPRYTPNRSHHPDAERNSSDWSALTEKPSQQQQPSPQAPSHHHDQQHQAPYQPAPPPQHQYQPPQQQQQQPFQGQGQGQSSSSRYLDGDSDDLL